jgi:hypothetical protein
MRHVGCEPRAEVARLPQPLRDEARRAGGGWLDEVVGDHSAAGPIPPAAIKGSWRLDANGDLTGEFVPNPAYGRRPGVCPLHVKR